MSIREIREYVRYGKNGRIRGYYEQFQGELTDEFMQQCFYALIIHYHFDPVYVFLHQKDWERLHDVLYELYTSREWIVRWDNPGPSSLQYPNRYTGKRLHMVTLPTIDENLLFFAGDLYFYDE
jgi:hypothetical protein